MIRFDRVDTPAEREAVVREVCHGACTEQERRDLIVLVMEHDKRRWAAARAQQAQESAHV